MENAENVIKRRDILKAGTLFGAVALSGLFSSANAASSVFKKPTRNQPLLLDSNENAHGYSALAKKALEKNLNNELSLYPDKQVEKLHSDIAKFYKIKEDKVALTNGSSAGIQASIYAANKMSQELNLPLRIILPNPTFEFVEEYAQPLGIEVIKFDLDSKFNVDIDSMKKNEREFDGVTLAYICNPNNPTSNIVNANDLYSWIKNAKSTTIFLLDEAYAEFVTANNFKSGIDLIEQGAKNVIVTRTFSKIHGLAGLRVGYVIAHQELRKRVSDFLQFVSINTLGAISASYALADFNFRLKCINANTRSKQIVTKGLDALGLKYAPCHANFIFHEIKGDFDDFTRNMKSQNILIGRKFSKFDNYCRVTLGTPDQMTYYMKILKDLRAKRLA